ncbi:hypothetical protein C7476_108170 [Phyllobacterium bourgognense]|uniref:Uncharacterized protein n=1 Tax=Phyllobacterium bourgognense TaxID=314236 RepID=A0A368YQ69_9HYPH|nr:hypothetical protein C7476_108170 [Phyllobacterium bourgognense]
MLEFKSGGFCYLIPDIWINLPTDYITVGPS